MALACKLCMSASARPRSFASTSWTTGHHRYSRANLSLPISAHFEQIRRRVLALIFGGSVASGKVQYRRREVSCNEELGIVQIILRAKKGPGEEETVPGFDISRLEAYTERFCLEILYVDALLDDEEEDQVIVFKGYSSSLARATPGDPSEPALPPTAVIQSIDRIRAPYNPSKPQYIEQGLSWQKFHQLLEENSL